jgi:hypothetical protein
VVPKKVYKKKLLIHAEERERKEELIKTFSFLWEV